MHVMIEVNGAFVKGMEVKEFLIHSRSNTSSYEGKRLLDYGGSEAVIDLKPEIDVALGEIEFAKRINAAVGISYGDKYKISVFADNGTLMQVIEEN